MIRRAGVTQDAITHLTDVYNLHLIQIINNFQKENNTLTYIQWTPGYPTSSAYKQISDRTKLVDPGVQCTKARFYTQPYLLKIRYSHKCLFFQVGVGTSNSDFFLGGGVKLFWVHVRKKYEPPKTA